MLGFRVWDSEEKRFIRRDDSLFFLAESAALFHDSDGYGECTKLYEADNRFIPMQFTGVVDMDNKPIYEGDVLFLYTNLTRGNYYYHVYDAGCFLKYMGNFESYIKKISNDGNIYECPALLKRLKNDE